MIMENKVAIITQSYKNDFRECKLLCESIDKFAPNIDHYIFVNDEDIEMFMCLQYGKHVVLKKSLVLPWFLIRVPWKMMGHHSMLVLLQFLFESGLSNRFVSWVYLK